MFLLVYARIYGRALLDALAAIGRNVWTLVLPIGLAFAFLALGMVVSPLGIAGGFLMGLAQSAACSIYTYFLAEVVAKNRVGLSDLRTSIGAYFWTWINLFFVLWIIDILLGPMKVTADGQQLRSAMMMMELIILNAAPEVIYLKRSSGGLETIQRSFAFLQENWIEWAVPNALILGGVWLVINGTIPIALLPFPSITIPVLFGGLLHLVMVYRGFLFQALDGSTHRQRMYRYRGKI
jgi:hypothetical protein